MTSDLKPATPPTRSPEARRRDRRQWGWCYLFLSPFLLFFIAFTLWPIAATMSWSFTDFSVPSRGINFVGLENFKTLFQDDLYRRSFVNTLIFALGNTLLKLPLSLLLAVLLTRRWVAGRSFFRTIYFLPIVIRYCSRNPFKQLSEGLLLQSV